MHFPGIHPDAAEWLLKERSVVGLAVDTLSLDPGTSKDFKTHYDLAAVRPLGHREHRQSRQGAANGRDAGRRRAQGARTRPAAPARILALV